MACSACERETVTPQEGNSHRSCGVTGATRAVAKLPASLWDGSPIMGPGSGTSETQRQEYERQTKHSTLLYYVLCDKWVLITREIQIAMTEIILLGIRLNQWWHGISDFGFIRTSLSTLHTLHPATMLITDFTCGPNRCRLIYVEYQLLT